MTAVEYENKAKWDAPSRFVNANPILLSPNKYGVPIDFLSEEVLMGSPENEDLRSLLEVFPTEDIVASGGPQPPVEPYDYPNGTLGKYLCDAVDARILNKDASVSLKVFSVENPSGQGEYVRNTNLWCADLHQKLTCCSPWNNHMSGQLAGTVITKRHVINAAHFEFVLGTLLRFITVDNQIVLRAISSRVRHPSYIPYYPDFTVYTLNEDLPDTITPCKLLPANYSSYLDHVPGGRPPALTLDQEEKALVWDFWEPFGNYTKTTKPKNAKRVEFFEGVINGDSGNPVFFIVNGGLVLLSVLTGPGEGTFLTPHITTLNQMIVSADAAAGVSTGYTISTADLSGFPTV